MRELAIPYGKGTLNFEMPSDVRLTVVRPRETPLSCDEIAEVERALAHPLGSRYLESLKGAREIVVVISDLTRPVPNDKILPPLLHRLKRLGIPASRITFLIATGNHRPATMGDFSKLIPQGILEHHRAVTHNSADLRDLQNIGVTSRGTPLWINKLFVKAQKRILTGMIEPHQFAGFTGGVKSICIGLGGRETIRANHALLRNPGAKPGLRHGNPVREDIEEVADYIDVDFTVNVVLDNRKRIIRAFAGAVREVQDEGIAFSMQVSRVEVPEAADIVIASPGGYPKDLNLYQAQKAVGHALSVVKKGGSIILVAECSEGAGNKPFVERMSAFSTPEQVIEWFNREGFQLGAHKAFLFARAMAKAEIYLVSDKLPCGLTEKLFLRPAPSIEKALEMAMQRHASPASVVMMPNACSTIAWLRTSGP